MLMWVVMRVILRVMRLLLGPGITLAATGDAIVNDTGMTWRGRRDRHRPRFGNPKHSSRVRYTPIATELASR
jgi:hypothetical protein